VGDGEYGRAVTHDTASMPLSSVGSKGSALGQVLHSRSILGRRLSAGSLASTPGCLRRWRQCIGSELDTEMSTHVGIRGFAGILMITIAPVHWPRGRSSERVRSQRAIAAAIVTIEGGGAHGGAW
jgi:hypothetical protein